MRSVLSLIRAVLAGRAAETVFRGEPSAGYGGPGASDLRIAMDRACAVICSSGLDNHPEALFHRSDPREPDVVSMLADLDIRRRVGAYRR
jgi:hypothetical protein